MKNLILCVLFFAGVAYLGTILYERVTTGEGIIPAKTEDSVLSYPARVKIESADGRTMQVTLLGRSTTHIQFEREDGQDFIYRIDSLAAKTRDMIEQYPNSGIKDAHEYLAKGSIEIGDVYVGQLEEEIRRIDQKLGDLSREYDSTSSQVEKRTIRRDQEKLEAEKADFRRKIAERQ